MNPISVYLIWAPGRERLEWVLLEVHNTPWNQQVAYLLPVPADAHKGFTIRFGKEMHVSPFMPMDMEYEMHLRLGEERLALRLDNYRAGERVFGANLALRLHPVNAANLARTLLLTPLMTLQVVAAIHYQALRLYLKGVPVYPPTQGHARGPIRAGSRPGSTTMTTRITELAPTRAFALPQALTALFAQPPAGPAAPAARRRLAADRAGWQQPAPGRRRGAGLPGADP